MRRFLCFLLLLLISFVYFSGEAHALSEEKIKVKIFYSISCKNCINIKEEFLPKVLPEFGDYVEFEYLDIAESENFQILLALEKEFSAKVKIPAILIGDHLLVGEAKIQSDFVPVLREYILGVHVPTVRVGKMDILKKFHSFSPLTIIAAGLVDGINPCAFTVLIFFISFLTLMGYKKKDLATIGIVFILAVFLTYLGIGLGIFKGLYELKHFYLLLKVAYFSLGLLCFLMAYLNLRDFFAYRKTKNTDSLKVKLPKPIRSRINAIISKYYRKQPNSQFGNVFSLVSSTFMVGVAVSLLEAVCTGQVYLPTIVFILKEPSLRIKALFFLLLYNFMFIAPLLLILSLVILGTSSKRLEEFFRKRISLVKILMFVLFLGLGLLLMISG